MNRPKQYAFQAGQTRFRLVEVKGRDSVRVSVRLDSLEAARKQPGSCPGPATTFEQKKNFKENSVLTFLDEDLLDNETEKTHTWTQDGKCLRPSPTVKPFKIQHQQHQPTHDRRDFVALKLTAKTECFETNGVRGFVS